MLPQVLANGMVSGSVYALVAVSFLLAFRLRRFYDFSFASLILVAPYGGICLRSLGVVPGLADVCGCFLSGAVAVVLHEGVFGPLGYRKASPLELLLASLGVYVVLQNCVSLGFGDYARNLRPNGDLGLEFLGARITPEQFCAVGLAATVVVLATIGVSQTSFGVALQAIGEDPELSAVVGLRIRATTILAVAFAGAIAGIAGIALALDVAIAPTSGMKPLLGGIVAVIMSGAGSVRRVAVAGLGLAMVEHLSVLVIGSLWKDAVVFLVLLGVLLVRPDGLRALTWRAG